MSGDGAESQFGRIRAAVGVATAIKRFSSGSSLMSNLVQPSQGQGLCPLQGPVCAPSDAIGENHQTGFLSSSPAVLGTSFPVPGSKPSSSRPFVGHSCDGSGVAG